jgi:hypothetical protein
VQFFKSHAAGSSFGEYHFKNPVLTATRAGWNAPHRLVKKQQRKGWCPRFPKETLEHQNPKLTDADFAEFKVAFSNFFRSIFSTVTA